MWTAINPTTLIAAMVVVGLIAVVINIYCVHLARMRLKAAETTDFQRWRELDGQLHVYGAVLLIARSRRSPLAATFLSADEPRVCSRGR